MRYVAASLKGCRPATLRFTFFLMDELSELNGGEGDLQAMSGTNTKSFGLHHKLFTRKELIRNLTAFWFFGLCNNYGYVVMLSAAKDILSRQDVDTNSTNNHGANLTALIRGCGDLSTGAVLIADIVPTLVVKFTAPFYMQYIPYGTRNALVVACQIASFLIVAFSTSVSMSLFGVVIASIGSGLGEITFLALAAHFDENVISTWSSGTGGAGIFGSLAYAGIIQLGVSPSNTLLLQLVIPVILAVCYWIVVVMPPTVHQIKICEPRSWIVSVSMSSSSSESNCFEQAKSAENRQLLADEESYLSDDDELNGRSTVLFGSQYSNANMTIPVRKKFQLIMPLLKFMIPLGFVYIGEYFINQGLQEFVVFYGTSASFHLKAKDQYRWYQVIYQLGVFISRSSVNVFHVEPSFLPILPVLQFVNVAIFFTEAYYLYMPSIWIAFCLIFVEGLLGGTAYVNTFYQIRQNVKPEYVEFSLGVASVADSSGTAIAGFGSIPLHNWLCSTRLPINYH